MSREQGPSDYIEYLQRAVTSRKRAALFFAFSGTALIASLREPQLVPGCYLAGEFSSLESIGCVAQSIPIRLIAGLGSLSLSAVAAVAVRSASRYLREMNESS